MPADLTIRASNICKSYHIYSKPLDRLKQSLWRGKKCFFKEFHALKNVSLEIRKGETVGIIGSNGSGKSTLLQILCGILNPSSGEIEVHGRVAALLELGAGFNPEFTGRENVLMNAAIMGLTREQIVSCYDQIVEFADIGRFIEQPVKTYSSGMYVRLAFATAVNVSPDILIVDEALSVGDIRFQQKCMSKIKQFCQKGTVIFVSHDTTAVTELCSRVIWIESGKIIMDGLPKLVVEKYIQYMYEGNTGTSCDDPKTCLSSSSYDMKGFNFIEDNIRQFGNRSAVIKGVRIQSEKGSNGSIYSGMPCEIAIIIDVQKDILNPIIGYIVKDRLGREIIGDSTGLIKQDIPGFSNGNNYLVSFKIENWPNIQAGDYSLSIAVADGSLENHIQCHWLHDAVIFTNIPVRTPAGIFSILNTDVKVSRFNT
ncbi:ABC transporter ATP-binding protein [Desulfonema limicola]|nr:ABC transporter ATP-binding protein [Desulfonema limicola]